MPRHAVILGIGSDIGRGLSARLSMDGWKVTGLHHDEQIAPTLVLWDLLVCCYGMLDPIGTFWNTDVDEWEWNVQANVLLPLRHVRALYPSRMPGASVCFFAGAGAGGSAPSYSAYAASKIMLTKMVELLDEETPDLKFFILGPGLVRTKIHQQTLRAVGRAANIERVRALMGSCPNWPGCGCGTQSGSHSCEWKPVETTSYDDIYGCLMACVAAPKEAVGGRNVCVHLDDWRKLDELAGDSSRFKLRRRERAMEQSTTKSGLLFEDGSRRVLSDEEMHRVTNPRTGSDWSLRLSLKKSQRPRLLT